VCTSASGSCQLAMLTCSKRSDSIAFGGGCVRDQYDRPVAGRINICPKTLPAPADIRDWQKQYVSHNSPTRATQWTRRAEAAPGLGDTVTPGLSPPLAGWAKTPIPLLSPV